MLYLRVSFSQHSLQCPQKRTERRIAYGWGNFFLLNLLGKLQSMHWKLDPRWTYCTTKKLILEADSNIQRNTSKSLLQERLYRQLLIHINEMRSRFTVLQIAHLHIFMHIYKKKRFLSSIQVKHALQFFPIMLNKFHNIFWIVVFHIFAVCK